MSSEQVVVYSLEHNQLKVCLYSGRVGGVLNPPSNAKKHTSTTAYEWGNLLCIEQIRGMGSKLLFHLQQKTTSLSVGDGCESRDSVQLYSKFAST